MNSKRPRHRAPKVVQRLDKGSQNRRVGAKSKIPPNRLTLLPGFLINGFTSNTAKKLNAEDVNQKKKQSILNEDLHTFLQQNSKNLRRSQRILKKHFHEESASLSKTFYDNPNPTRLSTLLSLDESPVRNVSFKSILKNNSKSIFKEINEGHLKKKTESNQVGFLSEGNLDSNSFGEFMVRKKPDIPNLEVNHLFCANLQNQICVTIRKNDALDCLKRIKNEIDITNLTLQGKLESTNMFSIRDSVNEQNLNVTSQEINLFPSQSWVYCTPPNQKIGAPKIEGCQLQAAVMCSSKNQQNIYEIDPKFNVDFTKMQQTENLTIDRKYLNRVAQVMKTPANLGYRESFDIAGQDVFRDCLVRRSQAAPKDNFTETNYINIITRPTKPSKPKILMNCLQNSPHLKTTKNFHMAQNQDDFDQDFTFIEEGDDFKIQQTQKSKRRVSDDEFVIKRRNVMFAGTNMNMSIDGNSNNNMFSFNSQEPKMFDFSNNGHVQCDS